MRVKAEFQLHNRRQAVMAFAEVDRFHCHDNPYALSGQHHVSRSAMTISASRDALMSQGTQTTIPSVSMLIVARPP